MYATLWTRWFPVLAWLRLTFAVTSWYGPFCVACLRIRAQAHRGTSRRGDLFLIFALENGVDRSPNLRHSLRFNVVANLNFVAFILHSIFLYLSRTILVRCTPRLPNSRGSMPLTLRGNPVYTMDEEVRAQRAPLLPICRPRGYATRYHSQRDRLGGLRAFLAAGHPGGPRVQVQPYADTAWHSFCCVAIA